MTEISELAQKWMKLDALLAELTEEKAKVGAELAASMTPGDQVTLPNGVGVRLAPPVRRFDPALATTLLHNSPDLLAKITVTSSKLSAVLARENLIPDLFELCQSSTGEPTLRRV